MKLNEIFVGLILIQVVSTPVYSLYKTKRQLQILSQLIVYSLILFVATPQSLASHFNQEPILLQ